MLTPEQLSAFNAWALTDGCAEGGMNMEEFHYWHSCFAAGIAHGRAEVFAEIDRNAEIIRSKMRPRPIADAHESQPSPSATITEVTHE